jgi:hypothetical protein
MIWRKSVPYETMRGVNILSVGFFGAIRRKAAALRYRDWRFLPHEIIFLALKNQ